MRGFLEFEKQLFHELGPEKIESLEALRKRFGRRKDWKGKSLFEKVIYDVRQKEKDLQIVPVSVFWGRKSAKVDRSVFKLLFLRFKTIDIPAGPEPIIAIFFILFFSNNS